MNQILALTLPIVHSRLTVSSLQYSIVVVAPSQSATCTRSYSSMYVASVFLHHIYLYHHVIRKSVDEDPKSQSPTEISDASDCGVTLQAADCRDQNIYSTDEVTPVAASDVDVSSTRRLACRHIY